jgi:hypothetical protein
MNENLYQDDVVEDVVDEGVNPTDAGEVIPPVIKTDEDVSFNLDLDLSFLESLSDLGPMIEAHVSKAMADLDTNLQEQFKHIDMSRIQAKVDRAVQKANKAAEKATARAHKLSEREAERAQRIADQAIEQARRQVESTKQRLQQTDESAVDVEIIPPAVDKSVERLEILRMVGDGKLSPEDAANLMAALA